MFWNFQAWHIIVNIKHSEQGHKMYCEGTDILCQDFSRDLTLCYDNAKRWRMPVTHGLLLSCTVGISLAICFCICIFLLLFKYNGILGLYQDGWIFFLVVNKWVMLFILFSTGPYTCQMRGPPSCIPSPLLSNFISTSFDTSHSLEQHGVGLLQDGGKFTFCLLNSLPSFQISLGVAGSGKCITFIFL